MKSHRHSPHGVALLITLVFIVVITVLIVGLAVSMRTDRAAAHSSFEKMRAGEYAQMGVDQVIGTLRDYASITSGTAAGNWVTQPGQLVVSGSGSSALKTAVPLHSGTAAASGPDAFFQTPNLNVPTFLDASTYLISSGTTPVSMPVDWIYVTRNNNLLLKYDPASQKFYDPANPANTYDAAALKDDPVFGRFAYWTDDESSKVNYNIAWRRGTDNANPPGHPSKIDLTAALASSGTAMASSQIADALRSFILTGSNIVLSGSNALNPATPPSEYHFFNTPADARHVVVDSGNTVANALRDAKFDLTHYNHDPDTTFFNEQRIVLTTKPERAGWTYNTNPAYPNQWVGTNGLPWKYPNVNPSTGLDQGGKPYFLNIATIQDSVTGKPYDAWFAFSTAVSGQPVMIDGVRLADVIDMLNGYLKRTDWPMVSGSGSLQGKYYGGSSDRLTQLSLNVIEYVRSKESAGEPGTGIVHPIRGATDPGTKRFIPASVSSGSNSFIGITRGPRIVGMGLWINSQVLTSSATTKRYLAAAKIKVHLPAHFGLSEIDMTRLRWGYTVTNGSDGTVDGTNKITALTTVDLGRNILPSEVVITDSSGGIVPGATLHAGEYAIITTATNSANSISFTSARPLVSGTVGLRCYIATGTANFSPPLAQPPRLDIAPLIDYATCILDPPGVSVASISTVEVDDPRVNTHKDDWRLRGTLSFEGRNANSVGTAAAPGILPEQDTDAIGNITDASLYMPAPPGVTPANDPSGIGNETGAVTSAGELGFISTGMESAAKAGVPWRTLHLLPGKQDKTVVPDWAFMDLFTAPLAAANQANNYVYAPHGSAVGGRVNLNAHPNPFPLDRISPLAAVLQGCTYDFSDLTKTLGAFEARTIARNIYEHTLAADGKKYEGSDLAYNSPGEVAEIKGVADGAVTNVQGERAEELVRQISNLVTARGNVFSVYTVGQAVKQLPNGKFVVTGEQRLQAMVERYLDATTSPNQIRFSPVYFRHLTP